MSIGSKDKVEEEFIKDLRKQQNNFNQLIEKALECDVTADKKFDVKKYLPKNEMYASKVMRKYQSVLNKKEGERERYKERDKSNHYVQRSLSDIDCSAVDEGEQSTFNYNFMATYQNIKDAKERSNEEYEEHQEKSKPMYSFPLFETYAEEINYDSDGNGDGLYKRKEYNARNKDEDKSEIELLNEELMMNAMRNKPKGKTKKHLNDDDNYMWHCLDYEHEGHDYERQIIENQFLSYKL